MKVKITCMLFTLTDLLTLLAFKLLSISTRILSFGSNVFVEKHDISVRCMRQPCDVYLSILVHYPM